MHGVGSVREQKYGDMNCAPGAVRDGSGTSPASHKSPSKPSGIDLGRMNWTPPRPIGPEPLSPGAEEESVKDKEAHVAARVRLLPCSEGVDGWTRRERELARRQWMENRDEGTGGGIVTGIAREVDI